MVRSVWQELLDWWNPPGAPSENGSLDSSGPSAHSPARPSAQALVKPDQAVGLDGAASSRAPEGSPLFVSKSSETRERAHLIDVSRRDPALIDPTDEELMEFLAADHEPVEADPEFKRKLRDQLWTLVQGNEFTRQ